MRCALRFLMQLVHWKSREIYMKLVCQSEQCYLRLLDAFPLSLCLARYLCVSSSYHLPIFLFPIQGLFVLPSCPLPDYRQVVVGFCFVTLVRTTCLLPGVSHIKYHLDANLCHFTGLPIKWFCITNKPAMCVCVACVHASKNKNIGSNGNGRSRTTAQTIFQGSNMPNLERDKGRAFNQMARTAKRGENNDRTNRSR